MSQHDMDLANAAGASFRSDANAALLALVSNSSGASAPATTFAYQFWADTTSGWLKQRDAANAAWIKRFPLGTAARLDVASAATLDLDAAAVTSDYARITGTTTTTAITLADGQRRFLIANAAWPITHGASLLCPGSVSYTCAAGDIILAIGEPTGVVRLMIWKADGTPVVGGAVKQIQPISASVGSNALTISASALSLDFRSTTLGSGAVTTVSGTPSNLVVPSSATLGTINATAARLAVIALNNAGTLELAVVNLAGGNNLDETTLISTTAISAAATANNVIYSTTARTNVAFRVIGFLDCTEATAGTWATAPSTIQGAGGQALTALSSLGYGQTWQAVTRTSGTTYYNTTGRPIVLQCQVSSGVGGNTVVSVNGINLTAFNVAAAGNGGWVSAIIPAGASYVVTDSAGNSRSSTSELR